MNSDPQALECAARRRDSDALMSRGLSRNLFGMHSQFTGPSYYASPTTALTSPSMSTEESFYSRVEATRNRNVQPVLESSRIDELHRPDRSAAAQTQFD